MKSTTDTVLTSELVCQIPQPHKSPLMLRRVQSWGNLEMWSSRRRPFLWRSGWPRIPISWNCRASNSICFLVLHHLCCVGIVICRETAQFVRRKVTVVCSECRRCILLRLMCNCVWVCIYYIIFYYINVATHVNSRCDINSSLHSVITLFFSSLSLCIHSRWYILYVIFCLRYTIHHMLNTVCNTRGVLYEIWHTLYSVYMEYHI